ncbi:MAG: PD-(D/E)XK nuclease family transposase [Chitinophagaceae bacterium]|nr:PD-(D/E)XK nuclease family transposase [Chitinophagaceae bacterium]
MVVKQREIFIDPFTDFAFKKLFGPNSNKIRLIDFLNAILMLDKKIVDISYLNNEQLGITEIDRKSVFDIFCMDQDGNVFIIEIQRGSQKFFKDRSIFYSMFPIRSQGKKGEWNFELKRVCTICFLDFCFDDTHPDEMIHDVKLVGLSEIPLTLADDPIFKELFMDARTANLMEAELEAYYASKKAEWDEYAIKETAMEEGMAKGIVKGTEASKKEIARLMKLDNEPIEKIIRYTGLSSAEIEAA